MAAERSNRSSRRGSSSTFGSRTDIGCVRDQNEDSLIVAPPLFVIADGMGGHAAGEVASEIAINVMANQAPPHPDGERLSKAVEAANRAVYKAAHEGEGREGMGTTVTACMLEGERLVIAQVGDSRAYLLHQGKLQQLTRDHSLMADMIEAGQLTPEEARLHPNRSIITRALGSNAEVSPDLYEINVETGDRLLICSDGLPSMVRDEDIEAVLAREKDPQLCASQLVNEAIAAGGHDNVTVIVVDVTGFAEVQTKRVRRRSRALIIAILVVLVLIIAAAAFGAYTYLNTVAYLSEEDGKVAVYKGVPDSIMGLDLSSLEYVTDVSVNDLEPGVASRLDEGICVENLEAADNLVKEYQDEIDSRKAEEAEKAKAAEENKSKNDSKNKDSATDSKSKDSDTPNNSSNSKSTSKSKNSKTGE